LRADNQQPVRRPAIRPAPKAGPEPFNIDDEERNVSKSISVVVFVSAMVVVAGGVAAQGMLVDAAADRVIAKYQAASCDQLKAQKREPPSEKEKLALDLLREDSKARVAFVAKIAAPVLNKMFECNMIP
jgi:hypothetical protein